MNEELRKLLALIKDGKTDEATASANTLVSIADGLITTEQSKTLQQKSIADDAIKSRDEFKLKVKEVGTALSIDINTDSVTDAIDAIKSKTGVKETEALSIKDAELVKLKEEISTLVTAKDTEIAQLTSKYTAQNLDMVMERDLALILPKYSAKEELSKYMIQDIKKLAHIQDNKIMFKNDDGTTVRINGADATLDDIVSQKREEEVTNKKGVFFDISVQDSGAGDKGGKQQEDDFIP